jgi:serine protease
VRERTRLGEVIPVLAIEKDTTIARRRGFAMPERNYRYWFRRIPVGDYVLNAGEDLDGDGFICELADACGWHGGPTEADAIPVPFVEGEEALQGLSILLMGP